VDGLSAQPFSQGASARCRWRCSRAAGRRGRRPNSASASPAARLTWSLGRTPLIQEGVGFADLGLVVIDEQHRFGRGPALEPAPEGLQPARAGDDRNTDPSHPRP